jgi:hypothetical protein
MLEENYEAQTKFGQSRSASHRGCFSAFQPACVAIRICETLMRRAERGLGGILVSPAGDWNFDHDHSKEKR